MNELRVFLHSGLDVVDSREVATLIHRPHNDLMKTIRTYCEYLGQGDFPQSDFFIENSGGGSPWIYPRGYKPPVLLLC